MIAVRRRLGMVTLLLGALLLQTAFFPQVRVFGVVPDVMVLVVAAVAAREGSDVGAAFGFATGLAIDLFLQVPAGLNALTYVVVGYSVGSLQSGLLRASWWLGPAIGGAASLGAGVMFVLLALILGQEHLFALRTAVVIPTRAVFDGILAFGIFPLAGLVLGPSGDDLAPREV